MKKIPADRKYTEGHLWFLPLPLAEEEGFVGITDQRQTRLGDIVAVELPRKGMGFASHDIVGSAEGILESFELEAFCNFEVVETNPRLEIHPDIINRAPYGDGWILHVRLKGVPRWLDAPAYAEFLQSGMMVEGA